MLNKVRSRNSVPTTSNSEKSYCNTIVRDNVTVTLTPRNNNNNNNNNNNLKDKDKEVNVTVTLSCVLVLHYLFSVFQITSL